MNIANERLTPPPSDNKTTAIGETDQEDNVSIAQDNETLPVLGVGSELIITGNNRTSTYENSLLGIKIQYPNSWKVFFEQTGEDCFYKINWCVVDFAPNSTTELGYGDTQFEIARTSFKEDCNCESLMDSVRYYYQQEVKSMDENPASHDFQFINDNQTMIAGNNSAWQIEYRHSFNDTFDNRVYDVQLLKLITKFNGSDYIFDYRAPAGNDFVRYLPNVKSILNSFEFISVANKTTEKVPSFIISTQDNNFTTSSAEGRAPLSTNPLTVTNNSTASPASNIIPGLSDTYKLMVGNTTFPIKYQLDSGIIDNVTVTDISSLIVDISSRSNGPLAIDLPRSLIDSKAQGNIDEEYAVFSDGQIMWADETAYNNHSRTLVIDFENGTEEIEILGTEILGVNTPQQTRQINNSREDKSQPTNYTRELEIEQSLEEAKHEIGQLRQQENSEAESTITLGEANQTTFASPYFDNREQQAITEEDLLQFANKGTSFDGYFKQRINTLNKTGDLTLEAAMEEISSNQSALTKGANVCMSPLGQMFGAFICDYTLSLMYEFCQTIPNPNQFIVCASPTIANYLAERNIRDGQTDRLAWLFPTLDLNELTANPFDNTS